MGSLTPPLQYSIFSFLALKLPSSPETRLLVFLFMKSFREKQGKSRRQLRVEEQVKRILGDMLRSGANDPRIGFVSVRRVEAAGDLKSARVYVSVLGEEAEIRRSLEGLRSARGFFQRELGMRMSSRYTPVITFSLDPAIDLDARLGRLLEAAREGEETDESSPITGPPHP